MIQETKLGIEFEIWVQPNGKKSEFLGLHDGKIKLRIKAPPVEGKANAAVMEFFCEVFKKNHSEVHLLRGELSRHKVVLVENLSLDLAKRHFKIP